jgi:hypothetical protein
MQMPQLVRIAHHIDRGDPAVLDVERRRLQFAIGLQRHEARQAIDEACADEFRLMRLELLGQMGVELHHLGEAGLLKLTPGLHQGYKGALQRRSRSGQPLVPKGTRL